MQHGRLCCDILGGAVPSPTKVFIARAIYHHRERTSEHVTLLVYKDSNGAFELLDDREAIADHFYLAGDQKYIFNEWGDRNRALLESGFIRDSLSGENKWQQFIS